MTADNTGTGGNGGSGTPPEGPGGPDNPLENAEQQQAEERKKINFIKKFIDFQIHKPDGGGVEFMNKFGKSGKINSWLKKELKKYASGISEFESLNLDSIKYSELTSEITKESVMLNNKRQELRKKVLSDYDITPTKYSQVIEGEIEKLEKNELQSYVDSDSLLSDKLKNITGGKVERKNMLEHLQKFNLEEKYKTMSNFNKEVIARFLNKIENGYKFGIGDFHDLFSKGLFNDEEKIEFVKTFIPTITLAEALKLRLVKRGEALAYKKNVIIQGLEANGEPSPIDEIKVSRIAKNFSDRDIIIPTGEIIKSSRDALRLVTSNGESVRKMVVEFDRLSTSVEENARISFADFTNKLQETGKIDSKSILNFKKGNIIALTETITKTGEYNKQDSNQSMRFLEIFDLGEKNGKIKLRNKGNGTYQSGLVGEIQEIPYQKFISLIAKGGTTTNAFGDNDSALSISKMDIYSPEEIIAVEGIDIDDDSLASMDLEKIQQKKNDYSKRLRKKLETEKDSFGRKKYTKNQIDEIVGSDRTNEGFDTQIKEAQKFNLEALIKKIDGLDTKGKGFGFNYGTTFQLGDASDKNNFGIYTITGIDSSKISIKGFNGQEEEGTFQDFYKIFEEKKGKRTSNFTGGFDEMIGHLQSDEKVGKSWGDFEFKNNAIKKKEGNKELKLSYPFLAAMDGESEEMIKINSISGNEVNFSYGKIKSTKKDIKGSDKKQKVDNYTVYKGSQTVSLAFLDAYIKEHKLVPRSMKEAQDISKNEIADPKTSGSFVSRLFNNVSIAEFIMGMKQGIESFEEFLKEGNAEHSALVAQGIFGKILPAEIKADLQSRVEQSQKKNEDAYLEKLRAIDSPAATKMIEGWLRNRDAPQYKKSAGLLFMLEKYGVLYAKPGLAPHRGTFLWYTALGGKIGDDFFEKTRKEFEDSDENFNEEYLVYTFVKEQCRPGGYKGVQRRSRLHKDIKRFRATGKQEEIETGRRDAGDERTLKGRVDGGMGELYGGTYPNAIGWLEKVVDKGGSMHDMSKISFIMAFSGIGYNFDNLNIPDSLKKFVAEGRLIPFTTFLSHTSHTEVLNRTILELSKRIESRTGGKYRGMGERAQKIFNKQRDRSVKEGDKIKETEDFFTDYGEILTRSMYFLNDGKTDDEAYLSKLIFVEKDEHEVDGKKQKGNQVFSEYYGLFRDLIEGANADFSKEDYMTDAFKGAGTSGMHMFKFSKNLEQTQGGGFRKHDVGAFGWEEIRKEFNAIKSGKYGEFGQAYRRKILKDQLMQFFAGILEAHSTNETVLTALMKRSSTIGKFFIENGINILELAKEADYTDLEHGHVEGKANILIEQYLDNMLNGVKNPSSGINIPGDEAKKLSDYEVEETRNRTNGVLGGEGSTPRSDPRQGNTPAPRQGNTSGVNSSNGVPIGGEVPSRSLLDRILGRNRIDQDDDSDGGDGGGDGGGD